MNGFDIGLVALLGVLVLMGLIKGLARILVGIAALVAAFWLAAQFHQALALRLSWIDIPESAVKLLAYLLIFLGTMAVGGLLGYLLRRVLKAAMLGWADRLAGAALGLVGAMLFAALLVLPVVAYSPIGEAVLRDSLLAPYVAVVADVAKELVPEELSESYRHNVEQLRSHWRERWRALPTEV